MQTSLSKERYLQLHWNIDISNLNIDISFLNADTYFKYGSIFFSNQDISILK